MCVSVCICMHEWRVLCLLCIYVRVYVLYIYISHYFVSFPLLAIIRCVCVCVYCVYMFLIFNYTRAERYLRNRVVPLLLFFFFFFPHIIIYLFIFFLHLKTTILPSSKIRRKEREPFHLKRNTFKSKTLLFTISINRGIHVNTFILVDGRYFKLLVMIL